MRVQTSGRPAKFGYSTILRRMAQGTACASAGSAYCHSLTPARVRFDPAAAGSVTNFKQAIGFHPPCAARRHGDTGASHRDRVHAADISKSTPPTAERTPRSSRASAIRAEPANGCLGLSQAHGFREAPGEQELYAVGLQVHLGEDLMRLRLQSREDHACALPGAAPEELAQRRDAAGIDQGNPADRRMKTRGGGGN